MVLANGSSLYVQGYPAVWRECCRLKTFFAGLWYAGIVHSRFNILMPSQT